ncbi:MAG TPA: amidase [Candidatus Acidoferrum sp.]|nr:amidase [Candidatus Acidoferrum sp.]
MSIDDPLNAFCRYDEIALEGSATGPLLGCSFAVKDVFDIAGHRTGNGHPRWLETHPPAERTASAVERLLAAGARLVGKSCCDEMTYSINGENVHYGAPVNPQAPGRIPGGSSSGSASAVSGGLVDFALGTDCGGSVRIPASYCGIYGIRTSHGLVPADGVVPLAKSFDTVGWFARTASLMQRVGSVLLPPAKRFVPRRLLIAKDAFAALDSEITAALTPAVETMTAMIAKTELVNVYTGDTAERLATFRVLQGAEIHAQHGGWIDRYRPEFGPGIRERFAWAATIAAADVAMALPRREAVARYMDSLLADDAILYLPTAPGVAPMLNTPPAELEVFRSRAFSLLSLAGLARLPQISLPLASFDGCPLGLSIVGPRGADQGMLDWAAAHFA